MALRYLLDHARAECDLDLLALVDTDERILAFSGNPALGQKAASVAAIWSATTSFGIYAMTKSVGIRGYDAELARVDGAGPEKIVVAVRATPMHGSDSNAAKERLALVARRAAAGVARIVSSN